jgi:hypothetical protein
MSSDKEILALEDKRYAAMCGGDFAAPGSCHRSDSKRTSRPKDETRRCKAAGLDPPALPRFPLNCEDIPRVSAARRNRSIGSGRLQEYNHPDAVLGRCEPAIRIAADFLIDHLVRPPPNLNNVIQGQ